MRLEEQLSRYQQNLARNLKKAGQEVEKEMHRIVAIKTGKLNESIHTSPVGQNVEGLYVDVGSENVHYAKYVEFGVKGKAYNYHRYGKVVYTGVGQKWLQRSLENKKETVLSILNSTKV